MQSHVLFPGEFGGVVYKVGESEKTMIRGLDFSEEIVHGWVNKGMYLNFLDKS